MSNFSTRRVTNLLSERKGLQRVEADGRAAYVLTELVGPVEVGDEVVVNTTAVDLGLGSGGWDVVHWNLSRRDWRSPGGGHVMKLRYTSLQHDAGAAEEDSAFSDSTDLGGVPVVVCTLHSQVACVAVAFHHTLPGRRLVYVMTDGAALPLALSDLVAGLSESGQLAATVTCGQAFGGDLEAVNIYSALRVAVSVGRGDAVVAGPGPGTVGTDSDIGFGSMEAISSLDAAARLKGVPILAARYSGVDHRERHRGVSHHTLTVLEFAGTRPIVPVPRGRGAAALGEVLEVDVPKLDYPVTSMGRGPEEDPAFFEFAAAAGVYAGSIVAPG